MKTGRISINKKRIVDAINHQGVDRIPKMFRALPKVTENILVYFNLTKDIKQNLEILLSNLNADLYSSGASMGKFTKYNPNYIGENKINSIDHNQFYAWGIDCNFSEVNSSLTYLVNEDFAKLSTIDEIKNFKSPRIEDFDFDSLINIDLNLKEKNFLNSGVLNCIFMIASYLRGTENLMIDLMLNKKLAAYYIDMIGEFAYELNKKILEKIGSDLDVFRGWDDMAMQTGLMIPHDIFKIFFLKWYKKIYSESKKYNLINFFHICGNANEIIPDLIDIGIDVLDPIQVSANSMDLISLKKKYGKYLCFHGGIDVQKMLPGMSPGEIKAYINQIEDLFKNEGGIILGPSHEITSDTNIENILAVYRPDLLVN